MPCHGRPPSALPLSALFVHLLVLLCAKAQGGVPLPVGTFSYTPATTVSYPLATSQPLDWASGTFTSSNGFAFTTTNVFRLWGDPSQQATVVLSGSAGCSGTSVLLTVADNGGCSQTGTFAPSLCGSAISYFTGSYDYSYSRTEANSPVLQIIGWGAPVWSFSMTCSGSCIGDAGCNTTSIQEQNFQLIDSTANITGPATIIVNQGNNTLNFAGNDITIEGSNATLIIGNSTTEITIEAGDSNVTIESNLQVANFITGPPRTCADWADWKPTRSSNFTFNSDTWTDVIFNGGEFTTGDSSSPVWSIQGSTTLRYSLIGVDPDSNSPLGSSYKFTVCLLMAQLYNPVSIGERLLLTLWNDTDGSQVDTSAIASSAVFYNHTNPVFLTGACASLITQAVTNGSTYRIAVAGDLGDGTVDGTMTLAPGMLFFISVDPTGCESVVNNYDLTLNFNDTTVVPQCGLEDEFEPSNNTLFLRNTGVKSARTNSDSKIEGCADLQFKDTPTLAWLSDVDDQEITADVTMNFFANGTCNFVYRVGENVTYGSSSVCDIESHISYLTASITGNKINLNYTGINRLNTLVGDVTLTVSNGLVLTNGGQNINIAQNSTTTSNDTSCIHCDGNGTLTVEKLCSRQAQCTVEADPPSSNPPGPVPQICWRCGSNGGGGGDDGGGGGAPPIVPIVPYPPFIVILIPPIVGVPGSGTPGSGLPAVAVPIITNCTDDTDNSGGMKIPRANFSESIPCCQNTSYGWTILETGSIPNYQFICKRVGDTTYAWVPNAEATGSSFNVSTYNTATSQIFTNGSTVAGDGTSQIIWYGPAYFGGPTFIDNTLAMCNSSSLLKTSKLESCAGTGGTIDVLSSLAIAGTLSVEDGFSVSNGPSTFNGDITIVNSALTSNGNFSSSSYLKSCGASATLKTRLITPCDGSSNYSLSGDVHITQDLSVDNGAILDINNGAKLRRTPTTATATTTSVTANGQLVHITVNAGVCDTSVTNPCVITITNSAITVSTTLAQMNIVSVGAVVAYQLFTTAMNNILSPSMDVLFYCPTACGPNLIFSFYVLLLN